MRGGEHHNVCHVLLGLLQQSIKRETPDTFRHVSHTVTVCYMA
jgi:hypothetical protein